MNATNSPRILVIDDDIDLLMLLERRLQQEGFYIETAASLDEAEDMIPYFKPQLVLLDVNVNGKDGRSLCWNIKNNPALSFTKVMLMSGFDFSKSRANIFGADEILPKPLNMEYLLHRIWELLEQDIRV